MRVLPIANGWIAIATVGWLGYMGWGDTEQEAKEDLAKILNKLKKECNVHNK